MAHQDTTFLEEIGGVIRTVTSAPTYTPRFFEEQVLIYKSNETRRLYWYDNENNEWKYANTSNEVTIADDDVATVTPTKNFGKLLIHDNNAEVGEFLFDISGGAITEIADLNGNINTSTSSLSGTTGTDAKITVSADSSNGQIDIENRIGASRDFTYLITP